MSVYTRVRQLRSFNRFYTDVIGLLRDGLLGTRFSLTQSRILFELGASDGASPSELAERLHLNLGYMSRVLSRLKEQGLVVATRSPEDARRHVVSLTTAGRKAFRLLDERSSQQVHGLLAQLNDDEQVRLMSSLTEVQSLLDEKKRAPLVVLRAPVSGDYGWVIQRHGELYAQEYGWDESFESLVGRVVVDYLDHHDLNREAAWIAEANGARVGCIFCMKKDDNIAQLRLLLVEPSGRGMGIGTRLVQECIAFATRAGYKQMMLWTNDVLEDARRIYERVGFRLVDEDAHHSFGHDLVGQNWLLELAG